MMSKRASAQRKALACLILSAAISVAWGSWIAVESHSGFGAFKAIFEQHRSGKPEPSLGNRKLSH